MKDQSKANVAEAACMGKQQLTEALARKIVKRNNERRRSAYHCPYCGWWHIGESSIPKGQRRHSS